jgi:hypothetical protein
MKKIMIIILASLMIASPVFALQEIAGPLVISVPIGGTGSAKFGLINDENETVTVSLRAEGDVANYLSFPATVDLEPGKIVYTDITAKIPADYKSLGNISGFLYALQEGRPGQVKINIQMQKSTTITVGQESTSQTVENPKTVETNQGTTQAVVSPTGLFALGFNNSIIIIILVIVIIIMFVIIKKRRNKK